MKVIRTRAYGLGKKILVGGIIALCGSLPSLALDSYIIFGAGPVNQSMGGAGTAAPLSPLGSVMWNPASAGTLGNDKLLDAAIEVVGAKATTSSSIPIAPGVVSSGTVKSDMDVFPPLPYFAIVSPTKIEGVHFLAGAMPMFGFGVDYPAETQSPPDANLLLAPAPAGLGNVESFHALERVSLGLSRKLNDHLSIGGSLIGAIAFLELSSALFVPPDDANGDGIPSYPRASRDTAFGGGFQIGAFYRASDRVNLGLSFQSPMWLQDFEYDSKDEIGRPRDFSIDFDSPSITSLGVSIQVSENTLLASDVRYIPFSETAGFDEKGFDETGAVRGLGWEDIWTYKLGVQHSLSDSTDIRCGYSYAENAVPGDQVFFGIPAPVIAEHHITAGLSKELTADTTLHLTGWYAFEEEQSGQVIGATGQPVPGTEVTNSVEAYSISLGLTIKL